jgi:hypothetical protein
VLGNNDLAPLVGEAWFFGLKGDAAVPAALSRHGRVLKALSARNGVYRLRSAEDLVTLRDKLEGLKNIDYVELDFPKTFDLTVGPDPLFVDHWNLPATGWTADSGHLSRSRSLTQGFSRIISTWAAWWSQATTRRNRSLLSRQYRNSCPTHR